MDNRRKELDTIQVKQATCVRFDSAGSHPATPTAATIPAEFAEARFANCPDLSDTAVQIARDYASAPKGFLVFSGSFGAGKSWLMATIANAVVERHNPTIMTAAWCDGPTLAGGVTVEYGQTMPGWRAERAKVVPLLFLDDFLAGRRDKYTLAVWDAVIADRYLHGLATVITTNETPGSMWKLGLGRLVSRMQWPNGILDMNRVDDLRQAGTGRT